MPPPAVLTPINPEAVAEAQRSAPPDDLLTLVAETFEALADPTRARILYALIRRPLCVRDLAIIVGITESGVSHQLRFLRDRRIVKSRRLGNVIEYSVDDAHVAALFREAEYHADHVRQEIPDHPYLTS
ncbi:MAG: metalloregulator ArsR/SmtB family transcription factor [Chloroflexota bacterium]|nr:metalloregulator ArsR/SmtB family transcription factor [Chloroflexota bacterium]